LLGYAASPRSAFKRPTILDPQHPPISDGSRENRDGLDELPLYRLRRIPSPPARTPFEKKLPGAAKSCCSQGQPRPPDVRKTTARGVRLRFQNASRLSSSLFRGYSLSGPSREETAGAGTRPVSPLRPTYRRPDTKNRRV